MSRGTWTFAPNLYRVVRRYGPTEYASLSYGPYDAERTARGIATAQNKRAARRGELGVYIVEATPTTWAEVT